MGNKLLGSDQPFYFRSLIDFCWDHELFLIGVVMRKHGFIPGNRALAGLPTRKIDVPGDSSRDLLIPDRWRSQTAI